MKLTDQIVAKQALITAKKDALVLAIKAMEENPTDETAITNVDVISAEIESETKSLESFQRAEQAFARQAQTGKSGHVQEHNKADHKDPVSLLVRSALCTFEAYVGRVPIASVMEARYGKHRDYEETKAVAEFLVMKAAQNPAMTNVPTWAQELTQQAYGAFMDLLTPESVVANLPMNSFSFDGFNSIYIPTRANRSKTLAAAFRAEGSPIRVGGAVTGSTLLTPKSLGVIGTFTAEMFRRSTPNIETLIRQWMIEDTSIALDGVFLGNGAGTAIQPAGIANSLGANTRPSTGNTQADITADLRVMLQAMASAQLGRRPVWIMDPQRLIGLQTTLTPTGTLAYPSTADRRLMGYPIVTSLNVPDSEVFLVDCAEINFAGGVPVFMGTDVATIHEEDTTPLALASGAQGSAVVATPQRSLFQTNSAALRTMWELDWTVVRSGAVQQLTAVSW
jgi:HK97 family phage major capsid protein